VIRPELAKALTGLKPGQRVRVTQHVRVGTSGKWATSVEGTFRDWNYLATGLATDRVPEDDVVVIVLHFTKDNHELSSITLDEHTELAVLS
jgi:hypothetical protein